MKNFLISILFSITSIAADFKPVPLPAPGTSGNVLTSNGSKWTSAAPLGGGFVGSLTYTSNASCQWTVSNSAWTNFSTDSDCSDPTVTGSIRVASTSKIPGFEIDVQKGNYLIIVNGYYFNPTGGINAGYRLHDGTTGFAESFSYVTGQAAGTLIGNIYYSGSSTKTIRMQAYNGSGGAMDIYNSFTNNILRFSVYHFPEN
jgi:hypothetical protein